MTGTTEQGAPGGTQGSGFNFIDCLLIFIGVVVPVSALLVESITGLCRSAFFDPIPSVYHFGAIALVCGANLLGWYVWHKKRAAMFSISSLLLGISSLISGVYSVPFLPLLPLGVVASLFVIPMCFSSGFAGFVSLSGLLVFAPLFALISSILLFVLIYRAESKNKRRPGSVFLFGLIAGLGILVMAEMPAQMTYSGVQMALDPETSDKGIIWLRRSADKNTLLKMCYSRQFRRLNHIGPGGVLSSMFSQPYAVSTAQARYLFYRVTGKPFNSVRPPGGKWLGDALTLWNDDIDIASDAVGVVSKELFLSSSEMDTTIDSDAATSYTEWQFAFTNESLQQSEARMQITLPPGGVVSRATLWVNGVEKEAAFASRSKTKAAYKRVVHRRRDPLLVTTSGTDRVLVQCFPVPPKSHDEMKIRIGITAPLILDSLDRAAFILPVISEMNFQWKGKTDITVSASDKLTCKPDVLAELKKNGKTVLSGKVSRDDLQKNVTIYAVRNGEITNVCFTGANGETFGEEIKTQDQSPPETLTIVVDGSQSVKPFVDEICESLAGMPENLKARLLFISDEYLDATKELEDRAGFLNDVERLRKAPFVGGQDSCARLNKLVKELSPDDAILWIHAPVPVDPLHLEKYQRAKTKHLPAGESYHFVRSAPALRALLTARAGSPAVYDFSLENGPNKLTELLDGVKQVKVVRRRGSTKEDLTRLFKLWAGETPGYKIDRYLVAAGQSCQGHKSDSEDLARLWAYDRILSLLGSGSRWNDYSSASGIIQGSEAKSDDSSKDEKTGLPSELKEALKLASSYHLVTPISGAVVLESKQQYDEAGLTPADPTEMPGIPEPGVFVLLLIVLVLLLSRNWTAKLVGARR